MSLLDNLVSYWKLNEASGSRSDSSGTNGLTDNNSTLSDSNSAKFVHASSQYLSSASNSSLQMSGNTSFTIATWVKLASLPAASYSIVTKDSNVANSRDYTLDYNTTPNIGFRFYIQGGATYIVSTTLVASTGRWYFVVAWYDSSNGQVHLQIDNSTIYDGANTGATGTDVSSSEFRIGARQYSGFEDYFDGSIGGVGIWKRLLTPAEKASLFSGAPNSMPSHGVNPIITLPVGSWYESQVYDFTVITNPSDSSKLKMYSSGMTAPTGSGTESIGLFTANSSDPYTWSNQGQILTANGTGWESGGTGLRIGSLIYDSGTYYLFYNADVLGSSAIGLATSSDGTSFTKSASNPILTPTGQGRNDGTDVSQPSVIKEGSSWTMIYSYRNGSTILPGFRYATSSDGTTWTKGGSGDILTTNPLYGEYHQIFKIGSTYYLVFESGNATIPFRIFLAESTSVSGPYSNVRPLFVENYGSGDFDQYHVATPFILNPNSDRILYYAGAGEHATPYTTNHWPGGATTATANQIAQYPPSATYPFVLPPAPPPPGVTGMGGIALNLGKKGAKKRPTRATPPGLYHIFVESPREASGGEILRPAGTREIEERVEASIAAKQHRQKTYEVARRRRIADDEMALTMILSELD